VDRVLDVRPPGPWLITGRDDQTDRPDPTTYII
jgi:hypothetical protein